MHCANGCLHEITASESSSVTARDIGNGVCIYEHRHLDCTRRVVGSPLRAECDRGEHLVLKGRNHCNRCQVDVCNDPASITAE